MNISKTLLLLVAMLVLGACGGGGSSDDNCSGGSVTEFCGSTDDPAGGDDPAVTPVDDDLTPDAAIVEVIADGTILPSDISRNTSVLITAIVSDASGNALANEPVSFSASNNGRIVTVDGGVTNAFGLAEVSLNHGIDLSNREIVVTATVLGADDALISQDSPVIRVVNTKLELTGGTQLLTSGEDTTFTATLTDSTGAAIPNYETTITSGSGNTVMVDGEIIDASSSVPFTVFTDSTGSVNIDVSGVVLGSDILTVAAAGEDKEADFTVSNNVFRFTSPEADVEINLGISQPVLLLWEDGAPVVGGTVQFTTTRGVLSSSTDDTNGSGIAQVSISSTDAGVATIVATDPISGQTNSLNVEFIATVPATLELKTEKTRVDAGEQTTLTAQVKDAGGNPVKNALINFNANIDTTNGDVFPATAITDSNGEARSVYTGGDTPSATDGVELYAEVDANNTINDVVNLTVAGVARDVTIGTGNTLFEIGTAAYGKEYIVLVKDGVGNPKPNAVVEVSLISQRFRKGFMRLSDPSDPFEALLSDWIPEIEDVCDNEDGSISGIIDGILDVGEDINSNGTLEPGNVAVVAAVDPAASPSEPCTFGAFSTGTLAADVTTNAIGLARVCIYYPQSYALWLEPQIEARTQVSGTEFSDSETFVLEVLAADVSDSSVNPPNDESPYGVTAGCDNEL